MATPRKSTKLAKRRRLMKKSDDSTAFYLSDGKKIDSISALASALGSMSRDSFDKHVADDKNDFSSWLNDVFGESKLAGELADIKEKDKAQIVVLKHLVKGLS